MARCSVWILFAVLFSRNKFIKCENFGFCPVANDANTCGTDVRTDYNEGSQEDDGGWLAMSSMNCQTTLKDAYEKLCIYNH